MPPFLSSPRFSRCYAVSQHRLGATPPVATDLVRDFKDVSTVKGAPVLGVALDWLKEPRACEDALKAEHGFPLLVNYGPLGGWALLIDDGPQIVDLLAQDDVRVASAWPDSIKRLVFNPDKGPWAISSTPSFSNAKTVRACLQHVISEKGIAQIHLPIMTEFFDRTLNEMRDRAAANPDEKIRWQPEARMLTFAIACRAVLGDLLTQRDVDVLKRDFDIFSDGSFQPAWGLEKGLPFSPYRAAYEARLRIIDYLRPIVLAGLRRYRSGDLPARSSFTEMLKTAEELGIEMREEGEEMDAFLYNINFLMFAGTDTTALTMLNVAKVYARDPSLMARVAAEQDALIEKFGKDITSTVLAEGHVTRALAQEILRIDPMVKSTFRKAKKEQVIQGVRVPEGTLLKLKWGRAIMLSGNGAPHIDIDQWLNDDGTVHVHASNLSTFGSGPRRCPGQKLATTELLVVLAMLARKFSNIEISPSDMNTVAPNEVNLKHPTGLPLKLTPRART